MNLVLDSWTMEQLLWGLLRLVGLGVYEFVVIKAVALIGVLE